MTPLHPFLMLMNILAWNSRGAASRTFPGRVREIQKWNQIDVLILCETRVSGTRADTICRKLGFSNWMRIEATGFAGGIWLLWNNDTIYFHYLSSSTQALHVRGNHRKENQTFILSCVYAEPVPHLRNSLWEELISMSLRYDDPWIVMGDFNAYLSSGDKIGGARLNTQSMRQFGECISRAELIETEAVGDKFT